MDSVKVKIENLLDIDDLSKKYNLSKDELIAFHNQHCELHELLPEQLPKYIPFLYIPFHLYQKWEEKELSGFQMTAPTFPGELTYGVQIIEYPSKMKMHYLVEMQRENEHTVSVTRQKLYVNDNELELMIEKLMETAGEALYPLKLSLNTKGSIKKILNREDIKKRWKETSLPELQKYYHGEVADEIITRLDHFYRDFDDSTEILYHNILYPVFFLPLYDSYSDGQKKEQLRLYFPAYNEIIVYHTTFSLQKKGRDQEKILIHVTGMQENNPENRQKGSLELVYNLDRETRNISSVVGTASFFHEQKEIKTEIEIYQLKLKI